jgi:hypothetical protein
MRERVLRAHRQHIGSCAQRCKKCSSDRHRRLSILKETLALQMFSQFTIATIDAQSTSSRLTWTVQKPLSRTLSRKLWQQKNFHGHSVGVSSALAKTDFLGESQTPIRTPVFRHDDEFRFAMRDRCGKSRASIATATTLKPSRYGTLSDAELGLQQGVDRLRIGLTAGRLHHLTDEPLHRRGLGFRLLHLVRIGCDDLVDHLFDRTEIGDLS